MNLIWNGKKGATEAAPFLNAAAKFNFVLLYEPAKI